MSDTECLGGHTFVQADEVFSNSLGPWHTRCDCGAREIIVEYNGRDRIWRVKMPAPPVEVSHIEEGDDKGGE